MVKSEQNSAVGAEEVDASSRDPQMFGDGMVGSSSDMNQGTTAGGQRTGRGQSPRSSEEAGNDRGAKGGRDVVLKATEYASHKGLGSAARLFRPDAPPIGAWILVDSQQWTACFQVSGAKACAAGATPPEPGVECQRQSISSHEPESRMRYVAKKKMWRSERERPLSLSIPDFLRHILF